MREKISAALMNHLYLKVLKRFCEGKELWPLFPHLYREIAFRVPH